MRSPVSNRSLAALLAGAPKERRHARHTAALAVRFFDETRHLHGLTKTARPLLEVAAIFHAVHPPSIRSLLKQHLPELSASQIRIIVFALEFLSQAVSIPPSASPTATPAADAAPPAASAAPPAPSQRAGEETHLAATPPLPTAAPAATATGEVLAEIARRLAAIVHFVHGLDATGDQRTRLVSASDDCGGVNVLIAGEGGVHLNAKAALDGRHPWNRVMPRPIRSVGILAEESPPAAQPPSAGPQPAAPEAQPPDTSEPGGREPMSRLASGSFRLQIEQCFSRQYGLGYAEDIEYVHEMRVALRRLRAALRVFDGGFRGIPKEFQAGLRDLGAELGAIRDLDVFIASLRAFLLRAPDEHKPFLRRFLRTLQGRRRAEYRNLLGFLESEEYRGLRDRCRLFFGAPPDSDQGPATTRRGRRPIRIEAPRLLRACLKKVTAYDQPLEHYSPNGQHALRIACKKMRYTAEFLAHLYSGGLRELTGPMQKMQDLLGEVHDCDVYAGQVLEYAQRVMRRGGRLAAEKASDAFLIHIRRRRDEQLRKAIAVWRQFLRAHSQGGILKGLPLP
jgi:CHAD domain-containing protein